MALYDEKITAYSATENNSAVRSAILHSNLFISYASQISLSVSVNIIRYSNARQIYWRDSVGTTGLLGTIPTGSVGQTVTVSGYVGSVVFPVYIDVYLVTGSTKSLTGSQLLEFSYVAYFAPRNIVARKFMDANGLWGTFISFEWCANSLYRTAYSDYVVPDVDGLAGFKNTLTARVQVYDSEGTQVADSGTITLSADYVEQTTADLMAAMGSSDPAYIDSTSNYDIQAILVQGTGAKYNNKKLFSYSAIKDPDTEGYTVTVTLSDRFNTWTETTDAIYYGDPLFAWGESDADYSTDEPRDFNFNIPVKFDTEWNSSYTVPIYINGESLAAYIRRIKNNS